MKGLTEKQEEILSFIISFFSENAYYPRLEDIASAFNKSVTSVYQSVSSLVKKGALEKDGKSYHLAGATKEGLINKKIPSFDNSSSLFLPPLGKDPFYIKVFSDDMIGSGIKKGDIALFDRNLSTVKNGDVVLASIEKEMYIRRYYLRLDGAVDLIPENDSIGKIGSYNVELRGVLLMLLRRIK